MTRSSKKELVKPYKEPEKKMDEINNFQQEQDETLYHAWEPFKELLHNGTSTQCRSSDTSDKLCAIHAQLNNHGREIKKVNEKRENGMSLTEIGQASIPFLRRLKEYGYDKNEVLKEFEKLHVSLNESTLNLKRLLREKQRINEEIKAKMNEHFLTIIKDDLPPKKETYGVLLYLALLTIFDLINP
nr:hypothetical protein [Tanacetum cinerariifolium]